MNLAISERSAKRTVWNPLCDHSVIARKKTELKLALDLGWKQLDRPADIAVSLGVSYN